MGDWFEVIADVEVGAEEADRTAAKVIDHLVERGIVMAEQTECVLGEFGYAPGPKYVAALAETHGQVPRHPVDGLKVVTGRTVFYSMGVDRITCPRCATVVVDHDGEETWPSFAEAIDDWYAGGSGVQPCPHCGKSVGLNDWRWSPPWGFGYLGFEFWNWPRLAPAFVAEVARCLGHRVVTPYGKI